jgi:putative tryptophan/tyrosine transport system substrate-binding protein
VSATIKRREFITLLSGMAAMLPLAARAQQAGKVWRIGFISGASRATVSEILDGFPQGMRELGYAEGKDFTIEWRFADGIYERFPGIAAELVRLKVDVIVLGTPAAVRPVQQATATIPIVMGYSTDPVGNGFVTNLARPGGHITGLASSLDDVIPKQMELLATAVPNLSRIGLLTNPGNPNSPPVLKSAQATAQKAGFVLVSVEARDPGELDNAFATLISDRVGAVIVTSDGFFNSQRQRIVELALGGKLPTMFAQREYTQAGGLMSYGESLSEFFRRAASFVDKILKGCQAKRLADRTADAVQTGNQPQDC